MLDLDIGSDNEWDISELRIGVAQSRFNREITDALWSAFVTELVRLDVDLENVARVMIPGALEIPYTLSHLAREFNCNVLVAIGSVIRGETYHFEVVSNESARAVMDLSVNLQLPIVNAILTTENEEQAMKRTKEKGIAAAKAVVEMYCLSKMNLRR